MRDARYGDARYLHSASCISYLPSRLEPLRSAKNPARHLRLELRRMARQFLSGRSAPGPVAGILRALLPRGRNRFDFLSRAFGPDNSPLDGVDAGLLPVRVQNAARDHP